MNQQQAESVQSFTKNLLRTVETQLEIFTKKQTTIIERWNKAEAKSKEQKKNEEYFEVFKEEAEKLMGLSGELSCQNYSLFQPASRVVAVDQDLVVRTNITLTRLSQLMEEVENSAYFSPDSFYQNISQGRTSAEKLTEADKSSATSLLERLGNCLKLLQVKIKREKVRFLPKWRKIFFILGKGWSV